MTTGGGWRRHAYAISNIIIRVIIFVSKYIYIYDNMINHKMDFARYSLRTSCNGNLLHTLHENTVFSVPELTTQTLASDGSYSIL